MKPLNLKEIQKQFISAVISKTLLPEDPSFLTPQSKSRISVYREGYLARIVEGLQESFEATYQVLGGTAFTAMTARFLQEHPSRSYNLFDVGEHLPLFLQKDPSSKPFPFLPDLAQMEWAIAKAFHVGLEKPLSPQVFETLEPSKLGEVSFQFQSGVVVLQSDWNLLSLWEKRKEEQIQIDLQAFQKKSYVLVYRKDLKVMTLQLTRPAFQVLNALLAGMNVGKALDQIDEEWPAEELTRWFATWMDLGLFVAIKES